MKRKKKKTVKYTLVLPYNDMYAVDMSLFQSVDMYLYYIIQVYIVFLYNSYVFFWYALVSIDFFFVVVFLFPIINTKLPWFQAIVF